LPIPSKTKPISPNLGQRTKEKIVIYFLPKDVYSPPLQFNTELVYDLPEKTIPVAPVLQTSNQKSRCSAVLIEITRNQFLMKNLNKNHLHAKSVNKKPCKYYS
jgi:hypothetical protein